MLAQLLLFHSRDMAVAVLAFVVLYKFTDAFAGAMTAPPRALPDRTVR